MPTKITIEINDSLSPTVQVSGTPTSSPDLGQAIKALLAHAADPKPDFVSAEDWTKLESAISEISTVFAKYPHP